jgi:hypothetical protein
MASRIAKLEAQHDYTLPMIGKMDGKLDQLLVALSRVEVLENNHSTQNEALDRAFGRIESVERQVTDTTRALSDLLSQIKGMTRLAMVLWTIMGVSVGFILNKVV